MVLWPHTIGRFFLESGSKRSTFFNGFNDPLILFKVHLESFSIFTFELSEDWEEERERHSLGVRIMLQLYNAAHEFSQGKVPVR